MSVAILESLDRQKAAFENAISKIHSASTKRGVELSLMQYLSAVKSEHDAIDRMITEEKKAKHEVSAENLDENLAMATKRINGPLPDGEREILMNAIRLWTDMRVRVLGGK